MTKSCVVAYYLIFSVLFAFTIPVLEGPDEAHHLVYINFLGRYSRSPMLNEADRTGRHILMAHHPPLYYMIASAITRLITDNKTIDLYVTSNKKHAIWGGPARDVPVYMHISSSIFPTGADRTAFYLLRILSVLMGLVTLICVMKLTPLILVEDPNNLFPAFFVASLPQFIFISAMITNDNLAIMLCTLSIYALISILDDPLDWRKFWSWGCFWIGDSD